jgi:3D (Asp-Asp-Asp) domain-containing protein
MGFAHSTKVPLATIFGITVKDPERYGIVEVANDGYGEYIAEDCGIGKEKVWIEGNEIDIFFDDHEEALEFGIQYAEVFICH